MSVLTCIGCLGGGCLCEAAGTRCGQSRTPTPVCEVGTQRRWGVSWGVRWTRWGPPERTWGWGGWTLQRESWKNTTAYTQSYSFAFMKVRPSLCQLENLILQFWKSEKSPTFEQWLEELGNWATVLHLGKIRFTPANREEVFYKIWQPLVNLLKS